MILMLPSEMVSCSNRPSDAEDGGQLFTRHYERYPEAIPLVFRRPRYSATLKACLDALLAIRAKLAR